MSKRKEIFISYDHRDIEYVTTISKILKDIGLQSRMDFTVPFGANFYQFMQKASKECFAAILILSTNYASNESWARIELMELFARQVTGKTLLIPIYIDEIDSEALPFGLQTIKSINNYDRDPESLLPQLVNLKKELNSLLNTMTISPIQVSTMQKNTATERRIRVQASNTCNRKTECPWCHWDEFDRTKIVQQPKRVVNILKNIKGAANDLRIHPRPRIEFTLTGGEPLQDLEVFESLAQECPENSCVISNGLNLEEAIPILKKTQSNLSKIRVTYPSKNINNPANIRKIQRGIESLLGDTKLHARFNQVLPLNNKDMDHWINDVKQTLDEISNNYQEYIPERIEGIAFLEPCYHDSTPRGYELQLDIFELASECEDKLRLQEQSCDSGIRKKCYRTKNNMVVEFVKVNCSVKEDYFVRCLECVLEKDICLSADGRIRICSGWDPETMKPRYTYAHFDESAPLVGISAAIRREYGTAGFYSHLPLIIRIISGQDIESIPSEFKDCDFKESELSSLLTISSGGHEIQDLADDLPILRKVAQYVTMENGPFPRLFREHENYWEPHKATVKLCALLLRKAYCVASELRNKISKSACEELIIALLLLEYLSVDESLFSSGRTVLARGVSTELLKDKEIKTSSRITEDYYADAVFCLGAIAMENVDPAAVDSMISFLVRQEHKDAPQIEYIQACIYRKMNRNQEALELLESCVKHVEKNSVSDQSIFDWLYQELRVEAQRSLGSVLESVDKRKEESNDAFRRADMNSILFETKLRYHALFSDGYNSMRKYFQDGGDEEDYCSALRNFSDSLSLAPSFYACLIRLGILELSKGLTDKAKVHLERAQASFSELGLLTDQEYLNSLLCELALGFAGVISAEAISDPLMLGMDQCTRIGKKDVECVRTDAQMLLSLGQHAQGRALGRVAEDYIKCCDKIIDSFGNSDTLSTKEENARTKG